MTANDKNDNAPGTRIPIPDYVANLNPYKPGKPIEELAREKKLTRIIKLASNENPLGPSPKAVAAIEKALGMLHRYVDPGTPQLVQALASRLGKSPAQIICGHGTDSLLAGTVNAFMNRGEHLLTVEGTFIGIYVSTQKLGHELRLVPLESWGFDLEAIADGINSRTRIVYLANPNNPTGTMFTRDAFEHFMTRVPSDVLVILDEAYDAYAALHQDYPNGTDYDYPNLLVTRTLSKIYGLGGLRIGYAVGPDNIIAQLYKVRLPFEPNLLAQAGALGALDDDAFLLRTLELNTRSLEALRQAFVRMNIPFVETAANFYMLLMPDRDFALEFYEQCLNRGLIVRPLERFGIDRGIRINSGTDDETSLALEIIDEVWNLLCRRRHIDPQSITSQGSVNETCIV
jgi:histidinol-phosphate aminotransferase